MTYSVLTRKMLLLCDNQYQKSFKSYGKHSFTRIQSLTYADIVGPFNGVNQKCIGRWRKADDVIRCNRMYKYYVLPTNQGAQGSSKVQMILYGLYQFSTLALVPSAFCLNEKCITQLLVQHAHCYHLWDEDDGALYVPFIPLQFIHVGRMQANI